MEKLKKLNKSVLYRKFEKILKGHKIALPDPVWATSFDSEVETCVM